MILDIYLTNSCNLRCTYCYFKRKKANRANSDLIKKTLRYFLDRKYKDQTLYCTFIGGEPTLEFEKIKEAVKIGKSLAKKHRKKIFFNLVTNGTLLNNERINFLKRNNFYIVLSFDGRKRTQDRQRMFPNGGSCFRLVKSNLIKLVKTIPNLTVRMTVTPCSVGEVSRNVKFLFLNGVDRLGFVPTFEDNWSVNDLLTFKKNLKAVLKIWKENSKKRPKFYIMPLINYIKNWNGNNFNFHPYMHSCQLGYRLRYSVAVDGSIYPCHRFTSIGKRKFRLGNVQKGGVKEKSEQNFQKLIKRIKQKTNNYGCLALNFESNQSLQRPLGNYQKFKNIYLEIISDIHQNKNYRDFLKHLKSLP